MFIPARQQRTMRNLLPALRRVSDGLKERGIRQAPIVGVELDELDGGDLGRGRHELFTRSGEEGRVEERKRTQCRVSRWPSIKLTAAIRLTAERKRAKNDNMERICNITTVRLV